jgi:two-component system CheB/CheR fusion protein
MRMSVDVFLRSLAEDQQQKAIAVILSGTGSDGSAGIKEIKAQGGMVMVQDPETATHDGMPRSAINTGIVDLVLPVEEMPQALQNYARHPYLNSHTKTKPLMQPAGNDLNTVLALLRTRQGLDFRYYKHTTLARRMERRMGLNHLHKIADYIALLRDNPTELERLSKDLLIGVTGFFRDPNVFNELENRVIGNLVAEASHNATLRVWVAGCSTGEEAYTLAMFFFEAMSDQDKPLGLQIFASDIDKESLETARAGLYPASIATDISPERLKRYFVLTDNDLYEIKKELREAVVFAHQNLVNDPPFSKLDLISCRNLMIYLQPEAQDKLIRLFHFALKRDGYLLLGNSESIGRFDDLFTAIAKQARIYRRFDNVVRQPIDFSVHAQENRVDDREVASSAQSGLRRAPPRFDELAKRLLLDEFAPATVIINPRYEVLYFHGPVVNYLDIPSGEPNHNLIEMLREGLTTRVRSAIHRAFRDRQPVLLNGVRIKRQERHQPVMVQVKPLKGGSAKDSRLLLVAFRDLPTTKESGIHREETHQTDDAIIHQLEDELKACKEDLQSTVEEMETSNEELKASNEEVMSINEELQSTNEELETSKEEQQSLNEELTTINNQLQEKVSELENANNDMENLLASTEMATVFLDNELRIKRYTPATTELFNLIPSDRGRPLTDLVQKFTDPYLIADAKQVLNDLVPLERLVHDGREHWYRRRVLAYRTRDNRIEGVVVTFVDVTQLHDSEAAARQRLIEIEGVYENAPIGLCVLDRELRYLRINERLAEINGLSVEDHLGKAVREVVPKLADQFEPPLRQIIETGEPVLNIEISGETPARPGIIRHWLEHWHPLKGEDGEVVAINIVAEEITERKQQEQYKALERAVAQQLVSGVSLNEAMTQIVETFAENFEVAICEIWTPEMGDTLSCAGFYVPGAHEKARKAIKALLDETTFAPGKSLIGRVWQERQPLWIEDLSTEPLFQRVDEAAQLGLKTGVAFPLLAEEQLVGVMSFFSRKTLTVDESLINLMIKMGHDLREYVLRLRAETALQDSERRFRTIVQGAPIPIMLHTLDGEMLLLNDAFTQLTGYTLEDIPHGRAWIEKAYSVSSAKTAEVHREFERQHELNPLPLEKEVLIRTKFGTQRHWLFQGSPLFTLAGGRQFMVSMAVDISARKEAEQKLQDLAQQLEVADQRKNEFLSVLGHELRNPLAALNNGLNLLQKDPANANWALDMMMDNLSTMRHLLDDLLDLNRISKGKIELQRQPVELTPLLERVLASVEAFATSKKQLLKVDLPQQPPLIVDGDPIRLDQIFSNLLTNAIKYTPNGGIIHIHAECHEETEQATIVITDTGRGIPPEWLERIFEPFTQMIDGQYPNNGLGIGLALVKQLVALHGGAISAHSEGKGQGARFKVSLPLAEQQTLPQADPPKDKESLSLAPGLRVLVVDDNVANLTTLGMILEAWECQVATAADGANALQIVEEFQPQTLILDIGLPNMSGYNLLKLLREKDGCNGALAIAISGFGHAEAKHNAQSAGFDYHLTKPADLDELHRLLAQVKAIQ